MPAVSSVPATLRAPLVPARGVVLQQGFSEDARSTALGLRWELGWRHPLGSNTLSASLDELAGYWRAKPGGNWPRSGVKQFGVTPVLRYRFGAAQRRLVEAAIGFNVITPKYQSGERRFSSVFNFGNHVGVGGRSPGSGWEVALRLEHFSNAGCDQPNPGENFAPLRLALDSDH